MTIIGTKEEIDSLKHECDGRCADRDWCIFKEYVDDGVRPVVKDGLCLEIETTKVRGFEVSVLNDR